jgi:hypothetical protein
MGMAAGRDSGMVPAFPKEPSDKKALKNDTRKEACERIHHG